MSWRFKRTFGPQIDVLSMTDMKITIFVFFGGHFEKNANIWNTKADLTCVFG